MKLDDVDKRIIGALQADGRRPYSRIAAELDVSESVVRYRAQKLEQAGVLQVVGIADPLRIGFDRMALLGLKVRPGALDAVCAAITAFPETSYVAAQLGGEGALVYLSPGSLGSADAEFLPQTSVLPHVDVVITHALLADVALQSRLEAGASVLQAAPGTVRAADLIEGL